MIQALVRSKSTLDSKRVTEFLISCTDTHFCRSNILIFVDVFSKYCTYVMQALRSKKIVAFMVACKSQVGSSTSMEVFALKSLLNFLQRTGVNIATLVTDRSTSVRGMMASDFPFGKTSK